VVKLLAASKDLFVASRFGTGDELDAFLIAYLLPTFLINVVGGAVSSSLIPALIDTRERRGGDEARTLLSSVTTLALAVSVLLSLMLVLAAEPFLAVLASGFSPTKRALAHGLLVELLPVIPLGTLNGLSVASLNACNRFALPALSPMLTSLLTIAALAIGGRGFGVSGLVVGVTAGALLEASLLAASAWKVGLPPAPGLPVWTEDLGLAIRQFLPMVAGGLIMSSTTLVDQAMAAMLGPGSVSTLNYGGKLVAAVTTLGSIALATAALPHFSLLVAKKDWTAIEETLQQGKRTTVWLGVPATLVLIVLSPLLIRVWFEHGAFTSSDTAVVSQVQALLLIQIPFFMIGILYVRLLSALRASSALLVGSMLNFTVNIALNALLMRFLGVRGIALSTSLVYLVSLIYLRKAARVRLGRAGS
jgi:putative peptidoglycan lipid II flippase